MIALFEDCCCRFEMGYIRVDFTCGYSSRLGVVHYVEATNFSFVNIPNGNAINNSPPYNQALIHTDKISSPSEYNSGAILVPDIYYDLNLLLSLFSEGASIHEIQHSYGPWGSYRYFAVGFYNA